MPPRKVFWNAAALAALARMATDPERAAGTVNIMARDAAGHIASAVSTSGWAWKYPGRLGDSPVIGAGNFADDRYGAAACTGFGELSLRASTARTVVAAMQHGATVEDACTASIRELADLDSIGHSKVIMNIVALDSHGHHAAASTNPDAMYAVRTEWMEAAELTARVHVPL